ncbi:MAG: hypothetical protein U1E04_00045 [Hylemonella sp.]|nr:hypothetical protein [Hylemonella sp.]
MTGKRRVLIAQTLDRFMRVTENTPQGRASRVRDMINTTWAGRMP